MPSPPQIVRAEELPDDLDSDDWRARLEAVKTLAGTSNVDAAVPVLVDKLRDPAVEVAVAAARSLGRLRAGAAVTSLREVLRNEDSFFGSVSRQAALVALSEILGPDALPDLRTTVRDLDADLATAAIELISRHGTREDSQSLQAIVDDPQGFYHPSVREAAQSALRRLPGDEA
ncbi:MAG: HEAT repeat domain-containing protein [Myxococcota bacterium]